MKKTLISVVFILLMLFSLAACGGNNSSDENNESNSGNATDPGTQTTVGSIELEAFLIKVQALPVMEEIASRFTEENPEITVRFVATPDAETALFARIAANDIPDIMNTYPAEVVYRTMMDEGLFVDLTGHAMLDNVFESTLALSEYNGKQFAFPAAMSAWGVFYRKDIFANHDLAIPTTYAEFIALAEALADTDITPIVFPDKSANVVGQMGERHIAIINNDSHGLFRRVADGEISLDSLPDVRVLGESLVQIREYGQRDQLGTDQDQAISDFITGRAAMFIGGTWNVTPMLEVDKDLDFAMFPFPNPLTDHTTLPVNIDTSYSVYAGSPNVDAAMKFLEFLARPDIAQMYADFEGSPPTIKSVVYNNEQLAPIADVINTGEIFLTPINFWPPGMRANWEQHLQQLFIDKNIDNFIQATENMVIEFYNNN